MAGPIVKQERRISCASRGGDPVAVDGVSGSSLSQSSGPLGRAKEPPIPEEKAEEPSLQKPPLPQHLSTSSLTTTTGTKTTGEPLFSPSGHHAVANSPLPISDAEAVAEDAEGGYLAVRTREHATEPFSPSSYDTDKVARDAAAHHYTSLDPGMLAKMGQMDINVVSPASVVAKGVVEQLAAGSSDRPAIPDVQYEDILRKDTLLSPEERNARLEVLEKGEEEVEGKKAHSGSKPASLQEAVEQGSGKPFKVEWIRV